MPRTKRKEIPNGPKKVTPIVGNEQIVTYSFNLLYAIGRVILTEGARPRLQDGKEDYVIKRGKRIAGICIASCGMLADVDCKKH